MKRRWLLLTSLAMALVVLIVVAALRTQRAYLGIESASENLLRVQELASAIGKLRRTPTQAALASTPTGEIARKLQLAAEKATIPLAQLSRIDPRPIRRMGDSAYLAQETRVELRNVTLAQLVTWLQEITAQANDLTATGLRLVAPREPNPASDASETWSVEVTLTQLVFSPQSRRTPK